MEKHTLSALGKEPAHAESRCGQHERRRTLRREADRTADRYPSSLLVPLVLIVGLNVLDALFTMMLLDRWVYEANPIVHAVILTHGNQFWIWKFFLVSFCLVLLCIHSHRSWVRKIIVALTTIYLTTVLYQVYLLMYRLQ
jgi:hypothetical protein